MGFIEIDDSFLCQGDCLLNAALKAHVARSLPPYDSNKFVSISKEKTLLAKLSAPQDARRKLKLRLLSGNVSRLISIGALSLSGAALVCLSVFFTRYTSSSPPSYLHYLCQ